MNSSFLIKNSLDAWPLSLERIAVRYWYVFIIVSYLILALLSLNTRFIQPDQIPQYFTEPKTVFTSHVFNLLYASTALMCVTYLAWQKRLPSTFVSLWDFGIISGLPRKAYFNYINKYARWLHSPIRYFLILLLLSGNLIYFWQSSVITRILFDFGSRYDLWTFFILTFIKNVIIPLVVTYFCGGACWIILITSIFLYNLPNHFKLKISPGHPDNCGGLKIIGNFCLMMTSPFLIGIITLSILSFPFFWQSGYSLYTNLALYLFVIPLAFIVFFLPIWSFHESMLKARYLFENEIAKK